MYSDRHRYAYNTPIIIAKRFEEYVKSLYNVDGGSCSNFYADYTIKIILYNIACYI